MAGDSKNWGAMIGVQRESTYEWFLPCHFPVVKRLKLLLWPDCCEGNGVQKYWCIGNRDGVSSSILTNNCRLDVNVLVLGPFQYSRSRCIPKLCTGLTVASGPGNPGSFQVWCGGCVGGHYVALVEAVTGCIWSAELIQFVAWVHVCC